MSVESKLEIAFQMWKLFFFEGKAMLPCQCREGRQHSTHSFTQENILVISSKPFVLLWSTGVWPLTSLESRLLLRDAT